MTPGAWMGQRLQLAQNAAKDGDPATCVKLLLDAVQPMPRRFGAPEAMAFVAKAHLAARQAHKGEVAGLTAVRLASNLVETELLFDTWVNLCSFSGQLKSFEEAYAYGLKAERIKEGDPDLEANLSMAAVFTGREDEALRRFEKLKTTSPVKAGAVEAYFRPGAADIPEMTPTTHLDCKDILNRIRSSVERWAMEELQAAVAELGRQPDGMGARDCWMELCRFYFRLIEVADDDEFLIFQGYAGIAAASAKGINLDLAEADRGLLLWKWRALALRQLRLYDDAAAVLQHLAALVPHNPELAQMLEDCRARAAAAATTETLLRAAESAVRMPRLFWDAYDLYQDAFFRRGETLDQRIDRSHALHSKAYDLFHTNRPEAVALLCQAAASVPDIAHTWQELATIHFLMRRFREAEQFQRYAVALVDTDSPLPDDAGRYWFNLANIRLNRVKAEPAFSPERHGAKLQQAAEDAQRALQLGDKRAQAILGEASSMLHRAAPRWWKVWS